MKIVEWIGGEQVVRDMTPEEIEAAFPTPSPEQIQAEYAAAIDAHVEATARSRRYNGAAHLASYVNSTVPAWSAEATVFVAWRDSVWLQVLGVMAGVQQGDPLPALADLIESLPEPVWPA